MMNNIGKITKIHDIQLDILRQIIFSIHVHNKIKNIFDKNIIYTLSSLHKTFPIQNILRVPKNPNDVNINPVIEIIKYNNAGLHKFLKPINSI